MAELEGLDTELEEAVGVLGIADHIEHLREAARQSRQTLDEATQWFRDHVPESEAPGMDVLVFGSYARQEASGPSDFDYLVVAHALPPEEHVTCTRRLLSAGQSFIDEALSSPGQKSAAPGATGLFGKIASAPDLSERIGLEQDTNASHTRRLLLLQESTSVYRPGLREQLLRTVLARYQLANRDQTRPPRFLVNDFIRYWYTLAVDYQAKRWERNERGWGLRYLKLISSRKLTYAGTLAVLLSVDEERPATIELLSSAFSKPPLARLASLALDDRFDQREALCDVLLFAEAFSQFLANPELREDAEKIDSLEGMDEHPQLAEIRTAARQMDERLKTVFLDSFLGEHTKRYLLF